MKPRTGVYLSEHMAARLTAAAARTGATKSALIEAALDHFLEFHEDVDHGGLVAHRLDALGRQLERLDRDLRTVNETVALHARFHLAVTPPMPVPAQHAACTLGSERFEEFATQVQRRVGLGTSLLQETMERRRAPRDDPSNDHDDGRSRGPNLAGEAPNLRASTANDDGLERPAAVREDGSDRNFPEQTDSPFH